MFSFENMFEIFQFAKVELAHKNIFIRVILLKGKDQNIKISKLIWINQTFVFIQLILKISYNWPLSFQYINFFQLNKTSSILIIVQQNLYLYKTTQYKNFTNLQTQTEIYNLVSKIINKNTIQRAFKNIKQMSMIQSKMAKSLQDHNLQNLVFQKRQRKTIQQVLINTTLKIQKRKPIKKEPKLIYKSNEKKETAQTKKKSAPKLRKYLSSKVLKQKNNNRNLSTKLKQKNINQHLSNKLKNLKKDKQELNSNQQIISENKNKNKSENEQINDLNKINKEADKEVNKDNSQINKTNKQIKKANHINKVNKVKQEINTQNKFKILNIQQKKYNQIKVQNDNQINIDSQKIILGANAQNQLSPIKIKKKGRPCKVTSQYKSCLNDQKAQNQIQNNFKDNQVVVKRQDNNICIKKVIDDLVPRMRQAKMNALKKYTQKSIFVQDSYDEQRIFSSKKKKIAKVQGHYSINRIFRKQTKLQLNALSIPVKLNQFSLNKFVSKFGQFDLIHCSLPLSLLWELNELENLMIKGFIFIWLQRGQIPLAYHFMNRFGYDVIDQIIWVKSDQSQATVFSQPITKQEPFINQNSLFLNSKSICMIGYKCPSGQKAEYRTKISNNLIFARPFQNPIQKPDEIFQIADLLMPGSKKLELGGPPQSGWLSLQHKQARPQKCSYCFKQIFLNGYLKLGQQGKLFSLCQSCLMIKQAQHENSQNDEKSKNQNQNEFSNNLLRIKRIQYISYFTNQTCIQCQYENESSVMFLIKEDNISQKKYLCQDSLIKLFGSIDQVKIIIRRQIYLNSQNRECSSCAKNTLISFYYECVSSACKLNNHVLCAECFWKEGFNLFSEISQKSVITDINIKKKSQLTHDWRLRQIISYPDQKLTCFCNNQLTLPYLVCQTCVGWKWCFKCQLSTLQGLNHVHQFGTQNSPQHHKLTLVG